MYVCVWLYTYIGLMRHIPWHTYGLLWNVPVTFRLIGTMYVFSIYNNNLVLDEVEYDLKNNIMEIEEGVNWLW